MSDARTAYEALDWPWQLAFDEAWTSWCRGSAGFGAVISDGGDVVAALEVLWPRLIELGTMAQW